MIDKHHDEQYNEKIAQFRAQLEACEYTSYDIDDIFKKFIDGGIIVEDDNEKSIISFKNIIMFEANFFKITISQIEKNAFGVRKVDETQEEFQVRMQACAEALRKHVQDINVLNNILLEIIDMNSYVTNSTHTQIDRR